MYVNLRLYCLLELSFWYAQLNEPKYCYNAQNKTACLYKRIQVFRTKRDDEMFVLLTGSYLHNLNMSLLGIDQAPYKEVCYGNSSSKLPTFRYPPSVLLRSLQPTSFLFPHFFQYLFLFKRTI